MRDTRYRTQEAEMWHKLLNYKFACRKGISSKPGSPGAKRITIFGNGLPQPVCAKGFVSNRFTKRLAPPGAKVINVRLTPSTFSFPWMA